MEPTTWREKMNSQNQDKKGKRRKAKNETREDQTTPHKA
jgi:hypothetical protein